MASPGSQLRRVRLRRKLSLRQVVAQSRKIAKQRRNAGYRLSLAILSNLERDAVVPVIYRLHALALIYKTPVARLLSFYGI
jgi:transcriptional regulator with XRE-family HTH domain